MPDQNRLLGRVNRIGGERVPQNEGVAWYFRFLFTISVVRK